MGDTVPTGCHTEPDAGGHRADEPPALPATSDESWWTPKLATKAHDQFGSLGSGNHFVEVCLDEADRVWIVPHSGSRGVGNQLASFHIDTAKALAAATEVGDLAALPDRDLAWLSEGSPEFDADITDMLWAQDYALGNRQRMLGLVHAALVRFLGRELDDVPIVDEINCHHNFTERETHVIDGAPRDVWLTRKGEIRAPHR